MHLEEAVVKLLDERRAGGLSRKKAESAIRALVETIGDIDTRCLVQTSAEVGLGSLVALPDDAAIWIVTGEYCDGTFDIMREGGMTRQDFLIGWRPGESYSDYFVTLNKEVADDLAKNPPKKMKNNGAVKGGLFTSDSAQKLNKKGSPNDRTPLRVVPDRD